MKSATADAMVIYLLAKIAGFDFRVSFICVLIAFIGGILLDD
jgi:hypothetical protein